MGLLLVVAAPVVARTGPPQLVGGAAEVWLAWFRDHAPAVAVIGMLTTVGWSWVLAFLLLVVVREPRRRPTDALAGALGVAVAVLAALGCLCFVVVNLLQAYVALSTLARSPAGPPATALGVYVSSRSLVPVAAVLLGAALLLLAHHAVPGPRLPTWATTLCGAAGLAGGAVALLLGPGGSRAAVLALLPVEGWILAAGWRTLRPGPLRARRSTPPLL